MNRSHTFEIDDSSEVIKLLILSRFSVFGFAIRREWPSGRKLLPCLAMLTSPG